MLTDHYPISVPLLLDAGLPLHHFQLTFIFTLSLAADSLLTSTPTDNLKPPSYELNPQLGLIDASSVLACLIFQAIAKRLLWSIALDADTATK